MKNFQVENEDTTYSIPDSVMIAHGMLMLDYSAKKACKEGPKGAEIAAPEREELVAFA